MRAQVWTPPAPQNPAALARFCARLAMRAHRAGQPAAARHWLDRAQTFAARI